MPVALPSKLEPALSSPSLIPLSSTTWAWMHNSTAWGYSNCGLVASDGQALLVDTQFTLAGMRLLLDAVEAACPERRSLLW